MSFVPLSSTELQLSTECLLRMMERLIFVREFELKCERMWRSGEHMVGEYHLSLGQEAIAVGTCAAIDSTDLICPSIRGMGVYLCRGTSLEKLMAAFFDRKGGVGDGRWAHWHSPIPEAGLLVQTGMLGSGLVTSVGAALAQQYRGTDKVVVAMLGDGATNTGYFHEGTNFAAFKRLPIIIVIENNQYAVSTPISSVVRVDNLSKRAVGYGIPGVTVDGNDVLAVYSAVRQAAAEARVGGGPALIECKTYRWSGSTVKDPDKLRPVEEKDAARKECPIERHKLLLMERGVLTEVEFQKMVSAARQCIDSAEQHAKALPAITSVDSFLTEYSAYPEEEIL